jgi:hypothetical protein
MKREGQKEDLDIGRNEAHQKALIREDASLKALQQIRCVVNATNAPALCQNFKAMFNLF